MLKSVDILLGVTIVMLVVSMIVTVLTQFVMSVRDTRGKYLWLGLTTMLEQLDPALTHEIALAIVKQVLSHPLVRDGNRGLGSVIHREELTKILLELAAGGGLQPLEATVQQQLLAALKNNGVDNPKDAMQRIRTAALQIEQHYPELSNARRYSMAILKECQTDFVGKINGWFDTTIDRVSSRFTASTRRITFACGLFIAVLVQLDTVALFSRLSMDDGLRSALVQKAIQINPPQSKQPDAAVPALTAQDRETIRALASNDLITIPTVGPDWQRQWSWAKIPGILLSTMLLSLGAPFWYNALKSLLRLRSLVAEKDDDQRAQRQTTQTPVVLPVTPVAPPENP